MRRIVSRQNFGQLLEKSALLARKFLGYLDVHVNIQIAASAAVQMRHAEIPQSELRTGLCPLGNADRLGTIERVNSYFCAENSLSDVNWQTAMQIVFVPLKYRVLGYFDDHVEIATLTAPRCRITFACEAQARVRIYARRYVDL